MSSLNIYYQNIRLSWDTYQSFKSASAQSDFDIVCATSSLLRKYNSDIEVINTDMFDIFRLDYKNYKKKNYCIRGTFIAVRKHLSAFIRREWMSEGVECVWVTVPARGVRSRLHIACVDFYSCENIYGLNEVLAFLSKNHTNDECLVVGRIPLIKVDLISERQNQRGLRDCTSLKDLGQFNKIKREEYYLHNLVFSSIPVTVSHCPLPLAPEKYDWQMALHFDLDLGPPECGKAPNDAREGNRRNALSGQLEALQARGDLGNVVDGLVQKKWEEIMKLLPKLIGEKFGQTVEELKALKEENDKMSKEVVSVKLTCEELRARNDRLEDDLKQFTNIEERLKTLEGLTLGIRDRTFGVGAGSFVTSVSSPSNLFGGSASATVPLNAAPIFSIGATEPQTLRWAEDVDELAISSTEGDTLTTNSSQITKATMSENIKTLACETVAARETDATPTTIGLQTFERQIIRGTAEVTPILKTAPTLEENDTPSTSIESRFLVTTLDIPPPKTTPAAVAVSTFGPVPTLNSSLLASLTSTRASPKVTVSPIATTDTCKPFVPLAPEVTSVSKAIQAISLTAVKATPSTVEPQINKTVCNINPAAILTVGVTPASEPDMAVDKSSNIQIARVSPATKTRSSIHATEAVKATPDIKVKAITSSTAPAIEAAKSLNTIPVYNSTFNIPTTTKNEIELLPRSSQLDSEDEEGIVGDATTIKADYENEETPSDKMSNENVTNPHADSKEFIDTNDGKSKLMEQKERDSMEQSILNRISSGFSSSNYQTEIRNWQQCVTSLKETIKKKKVPDNKDSSESDEDITKSRKKVLRKRTNVRGYGIRNRKKH